jgi:Ni/Fe-hydrogenase subunit HybB-like protein
MFFDSESSKPFNFQDLLSLRILIIRMLNTVLSVITAFEIDYRELADKYKDEIQLMINKCNFRPTFEVVNRWIERVFKETVDLMGSATSMTPEVLTFLTVAVKFLAIAISINPLSLELQKEADRYFRSQEVVSQGPHANHHLPRSSRTSPGLR